MNYLAIGNRSEAYGWRICGGTDRYDHPRLPIGIAGAEQAWLHIEYSAAWSAARKAEAVAAIGVMGIVAPPCNHSTRERGASLPIFTVRHPFLALRLPSARS
jgi:hypothetical protein